MAKGDHPPARNEGGTRNAPPTPVVGRPPAPDVGRPPAPDAPHNNNLLKQSIKTKEKVQKRKSDKFTKPSINEISEYCIERKNNVDATYFYNYYESKGWLVGRSPMKNWKAAIVTWEQKSNTYKKQTGNSIPKDDKNLIPWMRANGYGDGPAGLDYYQLRGWLRREIGKNKVVNIRRIAS